MIRAWEKEGMSLWWRPQGINSEWQWITEIMIKKIVWGDDDKALVRLSGRLPFGLYFLNHFADGDDLYLRYTECGNPEDFRNSNIVMQFMDCKIRRKWITSPMVWYPAMGEEVTFNMAIEARFSLP